MGHGGKRKEANDATSLSKDGEGGRIVSCFTHSILILGVLYAGL
jgi:hypothetical protein